MKPIMWAATFGIMALFMLGAQGALATPNMCAAPVNDGAFLLASRPSVASDGFHCEGGYHACMSDCSYAHDSCTGEACDKSFGDCVDSCFDNHCRVPLDLTANTTEGKPNA